MPTKTEWQAAGGVLLFVLGLLPWSMIFDFLRTWSGKKEKAEPVERSVTR